MEDFIQQSLKKLSDSGENFPHLALKMLLEDIIGTQYLQIQLDKQELSLEDKEKLRVLIERRSYGEPIDKILGKKGFYKYEFIVSADVLSPRPDTEKWVEETLLYAQSNKCNTVLDLGTGSGCIILTLLAQIPQMKGTAVDISPKALQIAKKNAQKLNVADRINFICKSWFDKDFCSLFAQKFDIITSNPPYIPSLQIHQLDVGVKEYDPLLALDGGEDGLRDYRVLAQKCPELLSQDGVMFVEIGQGQETEVAKIFEQNGLKLEKQIADYGNIIRCLVFKKHVAK